MTQHYFHTQFIVMYFTKITFRQTDPINKIKYQYQLYHTRTTRTLSLTTINILCTECSNPIIIETCLYQYLQDGDHELSAVFRHVKFAKRQ